MKITKSQLKQIIKEELNNSLKEGDHGQELEDLLDDIYKRTHLSIENVVDYWSSI